VLLLDEPSTGLDPGARRDLWQYLRTLRDEDGVSVLVTTHLMEEAEHCDKLAILSAGKLVALGSPAELKSAIGGDVVSFEAPDEARAAELAQLITQRFFLAATVLGSTVRLEHAQGHRFVTEVVEAFPGMVDGISVAKPSLEDVFIQRTGHRFWVETGAEAEPDAKTRAENATPATYKEPL
jgi:ABC-2 type transport system ATP-binding protein